METMNASSMGRKRWGWFLGLCALCLLLALPFLLQKFWLTLAMEALILGLAATAVNVLLGYGGGMPFGHAAFYIAGAYAAGILLKQTALSPLIVFVIAAVIALALGTVIGAVCSILYRFYFAMMTLAFSMLVWTFVRKLDRLTGGDNGLTGIPVPEFFSKFENTYFFVLGSVLLSLFILWILVNSPFGWTLRAIRENPSRVAFTGVNVFLHRWVAFIISSVFCGIAGVLFVFYSRSVFPDYGYWLKSGDMVTVCLLGGMFSFLGPVIGAAIWVFLTSWINSVTHYHLLPLGIVICVVVLLLPDGITGISRKLFLSASKGRLGAKAVRTKFPTT